jgi:Tol biopolymer transport system component
MQLFAVPAAGGTRRQLTHDAANVFTPRVSPDGRFIAATRIAHRKEIWRVPLPK